MQIREKARHLKETLGSARHDFVPSMETFLEIDTDKMRRDLGLEDRARSRGRKGLPPGDAQDLDEVERDITDKITARAKQAADTLQANERTFEDRLAGLNLETRASEIRTFAGGARIELDAERQKGRDRLASLRRDVIDREIDLETFRNEHRLGRSAYYPDSRILHYSIIVVLFGIETIINTTLFGQGHSLGLVGGFFTAAIISFVNVFILGLIGSGGLRNWHHRLFIIKSIGALQLAIFAGGAFSVNLIGAHLRDVLTSVAVNEPTRAAWESVLKNPLGIVDALSWIFFVVGFSFAMFAAYDFFKRDDPYPGYGDWDRRRRQAEQDYVGEKEDLIARMETIREETIEEMRDLQRQLQSANSDYARLLKHRVSLRQEFKQHLDYLEGVGNSLLQTYRDTNRAARSTPAPAHFSERWQLERPEVAGRIEHVLDAQEMRQKVDETSGELEKSIQRVDEAFSEIVRLYKSIEELPREQLNVA